MIKLLRKWLKGQKFSARHLNEVVEVAETINPIKGEGLAEVTSGVQGTSINIPLIPPPRPAFRAVITSFLGYDYDPNSTELQFGVGLYNARLIREFPDGIPVDHKSIQNYPVLEPRNEPIDVDPGYDDIVVINEAEVGVELGGFIPPNETVVVFPTPKMTDETGVAPNRKIYRTYYWPYRFPATITEVSSDPPFQYGWQKQTDTTRPELSSVLTGAANFGTKTLRYAVNALEPATYQQPVPVFTVVDMWLTYDTNGVGVFRFWYSDFTVGTYCDSIPGTTHGLQNKYSDTINVGALSVEQYDFLLTTGTVRSGNGHRSRLEWNGLSISWYGASSALANIKSIFLDSVATSGTPNVIDPGQDVTGFNTYPVQWGTPTRASVMPNAPDGCNPNNTYYADIQAFVCVPPAGSSTLYNQGSSLGTYSILDTGPGIISSLALGTGKLVWSGFLGYDCTGTLFPAGSSLTTATGFTSLQVHNGITMSDSGGGICLLGLGFASADNTVIFTPSTCGMDLSAVFFGNECSGTSVGTVYKTVQGTSGLTAADLGSNVLGIKMIPPTVTVNVTGGSGTGSYDLSSPCNPVLTINVVPPSTGISGIVLVDCFAGNVGTFATINALPGIHFSNTGDIGLNLSSTTLTIGISSCQVTIEIPAATYDAYGAAATALSTAEGYTNTQIAALSGTFDPLGAAATAQANAEAYSDSRLLSNLVGYTPGNAGNWTGSPTTVQEALDRIAAVVSAGGTVPIP